MSDPLLHMVTVEEWDAYRARGAITPPSLAEVGFVHLSRADQVELPANELFAGRTDVLLLVLDPELIGAEVRWEPGTHGDPEHMRFPHAYGPVPTAAVRAVLGYRPGPDGVFGAPDLSGE